MKKSTTPKPETTATRKPPCKHVDAHGFCADPDSNTQGSQCSFCADYSPKSPAPATAAPPVPEQLIRIPLDRLIPTPNNPRKIEPTDPKIAELAASIKANGLLQPGVARPAHHREGQYELLAGARRYEAHKLLGAADMLCIVRDLDDKAAMEVTVLENLQRADLTPLEEAEGVKALLGTGHTPEDIAVEIGKTAAWVARRARLTELIPAARQKLLAEGSTIQQMLAVSALPPAEQAHCVKQFSWSFKPENTDNLLHDIADLQQLLVKASFPIDLTVRSGMINLPACTECHKRTGCNPLLFGDDLEPSKEDRCLDSSCWQNKLKIWADQSLEDARRDHHGLILVRTEYANTNALNKLPLAGKDRYSDTQIVKKTTPGAKPAFVACGPGLGKVIWVTQKKAESGSGKVSRPKGVDGKPLPPKPHERQLTLHQKRCAWMVNTFVESVAGNLGPEFATGLSADTRLNVLLAFGSAVRNDFKKDSAWKDFDALGGAVRSDAGKTEAAYDKHLGPIFRRRVFHQDLSGAEAAYLEACRICRLFGYPFFKKHYEACMKALPVPRSWGAIPDPWADAPGDQVADPFDPKHEQPRVFNPLTKVVTTPAAAATAKGKKGAKAARE